MRRNGQMTMTNNTTIRERMLDWIRNGDGPTDHPVAASLARLGGLPILCIDGEADKDSGCHATGATGLVHEELPGGHHFGGAFVRVAERIETFTRTAGAAASLPGS